MSKTDSETVPMNSYDKLERYKKLVRDVSAAARKGNNLAIDGIEYLKKPFFVIQAMRCENMEHFLTRVEKWNKVRGVGN
jgi:hypothetical protein